MLGQISRSSRQNLQGETWMYRSGWSFTHRYGAASLAVQSSINTAFWANWTALCVLLFALCGPNLRDLPAAEIPETVGSLMIIGGSERFDQREYWEEIVRLSGGPGSRIAILPLATFDPIRKSKWVAEAIEAAGGETVTLPVAWRQMSRSPREAAADPDVLALVRESSGIYILGGSQDRIIRGLHGEDGEPLPLLGAIHDLYRRGGVVAGTSAGAAVMSKVMYRSANSVLDTLLTGVTMGRELGNGLGLLDERWFVEQHCLVRGRFARSLVAMHSEGIRYGIGVDENSAIVVRNGKDVRVLGYKGALVMDLSQATTEKALGRFNLSNVRLTYLDRGDRFDLLTMEVTPSQQKLDDEFLDPNSPDFRPAHRRRLFFNDILANMAVADLMGELIDSTQQEAIGLAFDGGRARFEAVDGFEFRFSRDERSRGWYTEAFGGDDYTVENIRLDIQPIRLTGPLYQNFQQAPVAEASFTAD